MSQYVGPGGTLIGPRRPLETDQTFQSLEAEFDAPAQTVEGKDIGGCEVVWRERCDDDDRAPRGRELPVREGLTRIIVDWSGSWQAARPGNWPGRSPATKAALGC